MPVILTPALREAMRDCEEAGQRVTSLESRLRKLASSGLTRGLQLDYDEACRQWRNARQKWERIYLAAGGRL